MHKLLLSFTNKIPTYLEGFVAPWELQQKVMKTMCQHIHNEVAKRAYGNMKPIEKGQHIHHDAH